MLISNVIIPILSSNRAPEAAMVGELKVKLENSRQALRKMSQCLGTTVVSSSSTETDEEYSSHSNEVDQQDPEFGKSHVFTTNVSFNDHNIFIYFFIYSFDLFSGPRRSVLPWWDYQNTF